VNELWTILLAGILIPSAPLILAAMGGLASERSGVMNIGLEGKMLAAACATALVAVATGSALLGLAAGIVAAILLSLLHCALTQAYRLDHIISGMALNAIAIGGTQFFSKSFKELAGATRIPAYPVEVFVAVSLVVPVLIGLYLVRTRGGLRLLAVGADPDKSREAGVDPVPIRYLGLTATGVLCGLSGATIVTNAGSFTDGMTAGRGFIALAALIIGGWRPLPAMAACLIFGSLNVLQIQLQGRPVLGTELPPQFWNALPYLATLIALAGLLGRSRAPAGLGKP
jgi:simple sugar transport system permease protein